MKLQLSYEIMFGYVQKLQIAHLIPLQAINIVSYNKSSKPRPGRAGFKARSSVSIPTQCALLHDLHFSRIELSQCKQHVKVPIKYKTDNK